MSRVTAPEPQTPLHDLFNRAPAYPCVRGRALLRLAMRSSVRTTICGYIMKTKALRRALFSKLASSSYSFHHVVSCGGRLRNGALGGRNADALHSLYFHWICHVPNGLPSDIEEGPWAAMETQRLLHDYMHVPSSRENKYDPCGFGLGDK
jgi:hypothetical protein